MQLTLVTTSTNVCSINLLHSLLGLHTAGSSMLSVTNPYIQVLAHTYVLDMCIFQHTAWYCWHSPLNEFIRGILHYCSAAPLVSIRGPQLWSTGDYSHVSQIGTDLLQQSSSAIIKLQTTLMHCSSLHVAAVKCSWFLLVYHPMACSSGIWH